MSRIDAHQHFWIFDPVRDSWITDELSAIKKDFLPNDFQSLLAEHGFDGSVAVQSDQSENENVFLLKNAAENEFIKGVVGWVDLASTNVGESLARYSSDKKMKGFRHVLQSERDRRFMMQPAFMNGIGKLEKFGFTYDILVFADQLKYIPGFVKAFPNQKFVIDHMAKPEIKNKKILEWAKEIRDVASYDNVWCKISGLVTEADWTNWKKEDLVPYIDIVVEAFGTKRIMFGSDWPVCTVAGSYEEWMNVISTYFSGFSRDEQDSFFGGNAIQFYDLR